MFPPVARSPAAPPAARDRDGPGAGPPGGGLAAVPPGEPKGSPGGASVATALPLAGATAGTVGSGVEPGAGTPGHPGELRGQAAPAPGERVAGLHVGERGTGRVAVVQRGRPALRDRKSVV